MSCAIAIGHLWSTLNLRERIWLPSFSLYSLTYGCTSAWCRHEDIGEWYSEGNYICSFRSCEHATKTQDDTSLRGNETPWWRWNFTLHGTVFLPVCLKHPVFVRERNLIQVPSSYIILECKWSTSQVKCWVCCRYTKECKIAALQTCRRQVVLRNYRSFFLFSTTGL